MVMPEAMAPMFLRTDIAASIADQVGGRLLAVGCWLLAIGSRLWALGSPVIPSAVRRARSALLTESRDLVFAAIGHKLCVGTGWNDLAAEGYGSHQRNARSLDLRSG